MMLPKKHKQMRIWRLIGDGLHVSDLFLTSQPPLRRVAPNHHSVLHVTSLMCLSPARTSTSTLWPDSYLPRLDDMGASPIALGSDPSVWSAWCSMANHCSTRNAALLFVHWSLPSSRNAVDYDDYRHNCTNPSWLLILSMSVFT